MPQSTTARIAYMTLSFGVLCLVAVGVAAYFGAAAEAFKTIGDIAVAVGLAGGGGSVAHGIRHLGSKAPTSAELQKGG